MANKLKLKLKLNEQDRELWSRVQSTVTAQASERFHEAMIAEDAAVTRPTTKTQSARQAGSNPTPPALPRPLRGKGPALDHIPARRTAQVTPFKAHGDTDGIDRSTATKVRRGKMGVEGRIDLHGMTQDRAHRRLTEFLLDASAKQKRLVLVITGKGNSASGGGVLRRQVPNWLNLSPLREIVLTYDYSRPELGGDGALTIMLKRRRANR